MDTGDGADVNYDDVYSVDEEYQMSTGSLTNGNNIKFKTISRPNFLC